MAVDTMAADIAAAMAAAMTVAVVTVATLAAMMMSSHYPSPLCRLKWAVTHVIGLHVELTMLGEYDGALMTIILISNIVFVVVTRAH